MIDAANQTSYAESEFAMKPERSPLPSYLAAVLLLNLFCLFFNGHGGDLGYWQNWVQQLSGQGYAHFNGDYPPLYIHWLYLVGQYYALSAHAIEVNDLLKYLSQIPVVLAHCMLTVIVVKLCQHRACSPSFSKAVIWLTIVNPAILINGPMWGQIDLLPSTILLAAILIAFKPRFCHFTLPLFALALLTKFQMIAFAPVIGFLTLRHIKQHLLGALLAAGVFILAFAPFIYVGEFASAFRHAYVNTLGQYPMTTFNAANLWILLTGNTAPDHLQLFNVGDYAALRWFATAKYFGMLFFSVIALAVFIRGIYLQRKSHNDAELREHTLLAALVCAVAFFAVLPAMHERYLFPAVVIALAYCALAGKKLFYPLFISLICSINMLLILTISGSDIWTGLSVATVAISLYILLDSFASPWLARATHQVRLIINTRLFLLMLWITANALTLFYLQQRYQVHAIKLNDKQQLLSTLDRVYARQDFGSLQIDRSFDGNPLSIGKRRFAHGLGTHADSDIQFALPAGAALFDFSVGLDDESNNADIRFSVWGDGKKLWESATLYGFEDSTPYQVDIRGVKLLNLKVESLSSKNSDHADWINPVITLQ